MTRIDKIRAMSDREIAELIVRSEDERGIIDCACKQHQEKWEACNEKNETGSMITGECIECMLDYLHSEENDGR